MDIFKQGQAVDIPTVLKNRDYRVQVQQKLVGHHAHKTVVAAKLNLPGPIKNNAQIKQFFITELQQFEQQLMQQGILFEVATEWLNAVTGPERFYLIGEKQKFHVKQLTTAFEESTPARRLFDLDVLILKEQQVQSISRTELNLPVRKCLICNRNAKECGRARTHSLAELQRKVSQLIVETLVTTEKKQTAVQLAQLGLQAMLDEVTVWPKPGLVDPVEHAAHPDMDHFLFIKSALTLEPYLQKCAMAGLNYPGNDFPALFQELRTLGKRAEQAMLTATAGINTHKGAVFSLGIMTAAVGIALQHKQLTNDNLQRIVRQMLVNLMENDFTQMSTKLSAGQKQYLQYQLGGVRAEASQGYPTVFDYGLKTLRITANLPQNDQNIITLMQLARHADDSTLIKRAGNPAILKWKNQQIDRYFELGTSVTDEGRRFLLTLQAEFAKRHLSLGGSADLLILTIFIDKAERTFKDGLYYK